MARPADTPALGGAATGLGEGVEATTAAFATVVVISGGIDLTPVTVMTLAGIVALHTTQLGLPLGVVVICSLAAGVGVGLVNGLLISLLNLNAFIVTLGTNFCSRGLRTS